MSIGLGSGTANAILNEITNTGAWAVPTSFWCQIHIGDPGADGAQNPALNTTRKSASFSSASGGAITTSALINWHPVPPEQYTHVSHWDSSTGGVLLLTQSFDGAPIPVLQGGFEISAGDLDITLDTVVGSGTADQILNELCNAGTWTVPTGFWVQIHGGDPGTDGLGNPAANTERQPAFFSSASGGMVATNAEVKWDSVSTSESYSHVSFWDASSGGVLLATDPFDQAIGITAGDAFVIQPGDLSLALVTAA